MIAKENFSLLEKVSSYDRELLLDQDIVIKNWIQVIGNALAKLQDKGLMNDTVYDRSLEALKTWKNHGDHGAIHSFHVYEGMREIAKEENKASWLQENDSKMQVVAALHDLMQILPFTNPKTGESLDGDKRRMHADTAANVLLVFGKELELTREEIYELGVAVKDHDDVYMGKVSKRLSYLGQLLSDADKLYGAGILNADDLAEVAIRRNQKGAGNSQGWYLLRNLSINEVRKWRYGDRWNSNRLSAVLTDMKLHFFSEHGRKIARLRKKSFLTKAPELYSSEYDTTVQVLQQLLDRVNTKDKIVFLTGKGQQPEEIAIHSEEDLAVIINEAYERELPLEKKYRREGFSPRGWMIQFDLDEENIVIDPSIARFAFQENRFVPKRGRKLFVKTVANVVKENIEQ